MKILILYNSIEWCEQQIVKYLKDRGHTVEQVHVDDFDSHVYFDVILNRVMPSVAGKDLNFDFTTYVDKLMSTHKDTIIINSVRAALADCDKRFSSKIMEQANIPTLKTYKVDEIHYPAVIKPIRSGRCIGVQKLNNEEELKNFGKPLSGYIIQEYARSISPFDYRVCVCNREILFAFTRTLVDGWLGSRCIGSISTILHDVPDSIKKVAIAATDSIKAIFNGVDVVMTSDGPIVIENNPTPNFNETYIDFIGFNPIERIMDSVMDIIKIQNLNI